MRKPVLLLLLFVGSYQLSAAEPCVTIYGKLHFYGGDGQLRIWHIGTHHDFTPDESSWDRALNWLSEGIKPFQRNYYASPESAVELFGDFRICPTGPFQKGTAQQAKVLGVTRRHYVKIF